jgi:mxaA protein
MSGGVFKACGNAACGMRSVTDSDSPFFFLFSRASPLPQGEAASGAAGEGVLQQSGNAACGVPSEVRIAVEGTQNAHGSRFQSSLPLRASRLCESYLAFALIALVLLTSNTFASEQAATEGEQQTEALSATGEQPQAATRGVQQIDAISATVKQARSFGYFVGDVFTQHVLLEVDGGEFEPAEWPKVERVGVWFERRPTRTAISDEDGRRWMILEYQIINAPRELANVELPAVRMEDAAGTRELVVPASTLSVSPLTKAPESQDVAQLLRSDREPPLVATYPMQRRVIGYASAFALILASWLAWFGWRNWSARKEQPFARAWEELRVLDERTPQAWQALHRAFDRTAGRVTQPATLATLFQRAPHLQAQRSRIERFFAQSSEFFFGSGLPNDALSVRELCRDLRRLERQHE